MDVCLLELASEPAPEPEPTESAGHATGPAIRPFAGLAPASSPLAAGGWIVLWIASDGAERATRALCAALPRVTTEAALQN